MKNKSSVRPRDDSATDSQDDSDMDWENKKKAAKTMTSTPQYFKNIKIKGYEVGEDEIDSLPSKLKFNWIDIVGIVLSILSFLFDVAMDSFVCYLHYSNGNKVYFNLTLVFIAVPSLAMTGFSLRWYLDDADGKKMPPVSVTRWVIRVIFLLLQMGPLLRYIDSLYYGLQSNKYRSNKDQQTVYYKQMIYEDADATLLRLFECFLESAPQLLLQLYIFAQPNTLNNDEFSLTESVQLIAMISSLLSMAWALASYHRALRYSLDDKLNMTLLGTIAQICWRFFDLMSRVLALGLFASVFPLHLAAVCLAHYVVMVSWILIMRTTFCESRCEEFLYNAVLGVIFIFCYFNPKDSPTRRRYTFYYICMLVENTVLIGIWFSYSEVSRSFKYPAMMMQFLGFAIGIAVMIIYYLLLHPTKNISVWAHWKRTKDVSTNVPNGDCSTAKEVTVCVNSSELVTR